MKKKTRLQRTKDVECKMNEINVEERERVGERKRRRKKRAERLSAVTEKITKKKRPQSHPKTNAINVRYIFNVSPGSLSIMPLSASAAAAWIWHGVRTIFGRMYRKSMCIDHMKCVCVSVFYAERVREFAQCTAHA